MCRSAAESQTIRMSIYIGEIKQTERFSIYRYFRLGYDAEDAHRSNLCLIYYNSIPSYSFGGARIMCVSRAHIVPRISGECHGEFSV